MKPLVADVKRSIRKVNEGVPSLLGPPGGTMESREWLQSTPTAQPHVTRKQTSMKIAFVNTDHR